MHGDVDGRSARARLLRARPWLPFANALEDLDRTKCAVMSGRSRVRSDGRPTTSAIGRRRVPVHYDHLGEGWYSTSNNILMMYKLLDGAVPRWGHWMGA